MWMILKPTKKKHKRRTKTVFSLKAEDHDVLLPNPTVLAEAVEGSGESEYMPYREELLSGDHSSSTEST